MPVYACGIPLRDRKLLLGKRSAHRKLYPKCWDVIGGKVEAGETVEAALARELGEELGISPTRWTYLGVVQDLTTSPGTTLTYEMFAVHDWSGGEPSIRDNEHTELGWFTPGDACALPALACEDYRRIFRQMEAMLHADP